MYKKVLFATDFDEVGIHAAHKAKKIADENGAPLFLVHVVEPIPAYAYPGFAGFAEVEVSIREQAEKNYGIPLSNIVYMGMGEPLLNYAEVIRSTEKITSPKGLLHMSEITFPLRVKRDKLWFPLSDLQKSSNSSAEMFILEIFKLCKFVVVLSNLLTKMASLAVI